MLRFSLQIALVLSALSVAGCAHVAAYDRGKLAEPSMSPSSVAGAAEGHVHAVHEGAAGGSHGESGCGCN